MHCVRCMCELHFVFRYLNCRACESHFATVLSRGDQTRLAVTVAGRLPATVTGSTHVYVQPSKHVRCDNSKRAISRQKECVSTITENRVKGYISSIKMRCAINWGCYDRHESCESWTGEPDPDDRCGVVVLVDEPDVSLPAPSPTMVLSE